MYRRSHGAFVSIGGRKARQTEADLFSGYRDASLCQQIFNTPMAEVEFVVQPDGVGNDIRRESVAFINSHGPSLPISGS